MTSSPHLLALSERLGILSSYISQSGTEHRPTSNETRVALIAAMGFDASSERSALEALEEIEAREMSRICAPVRVARVGEAREAREAREGAGKEAGAGTGTDVVRLRVPDDLRLRSGQTVEFAVELRGRAAGGEGDMVRSEGRAAPGGGGTLSVGLAPELQPGYYDIRVTLAARGRTREAEQLLVAAPAACVTPSRRAFGMIANLYSVRSAANWGVGDLGDLRELARWSGEVGAAFVGVNPLHALRNVGGDISPYSPVSRLYRNPIYLDVERIPELAHSEEARALLASEPVRAELARLRASDRVEYEGKMRLARPMLEALHRTFAARLPSERGRDYAAYVEREGQALASFALFQALEQHFSRDSSEPVPWQEWPPPYRAPASPEVAAFGDSHRHDVDFHRWVQFELDRQLADAAAAGASSGLSLGLYQDLAVASSPTGSDAWAYQKIHAGGVSIGAPPDNYSATGQNWGLPPLDPHRLFEERYGFWIALVRSALRHAGALRIDHVLGLFRQFWIPEGMTGAQGAYIRFPTRDLLGIVALESLRHQAVIVGEDLGTVPPEVPGTLREWGIMGTRVMLFEREEDGAFRPAASYEPLSLATADTHDMPTLAGFWEGRDIEVARSLGVLATSEEVAAARRARERDRQALLTRLVADGALAARPAPGARGAAGGAELASGLHGSADAPPGGAELRAAVHRFLCSTPAVLVGISLDDLAGETEPVNVPGVSAAAFPSWTRRMRASLESVEESAGASAGLHCAERLAESLD